jgi:hypothetical protein
MAEMTKPWVRSLDKPGIGLNEWQVTRWCRYGKHKFQTKARMATCCPAEKCQALYKEEQNRRKAELKRRKAAK